MMRKENPHSGFHIPRVMRLRWKDHEFKATLGYIADASQLMLHSRKTLLKAGREKEERKRKLHTLLVL